MMMMMMMMMKMLDGDDEDDDDNGQGVTDGHLDDDKNDDGNAEDDEDGDDIVQGVTDGEPAESRTRPTTASRIPRKVILTMRMIIQKSLER